MANSENRLGNSDEYDLESAENELRQKAKSLYRDIENTYWELGKALYEVFDGLPGGYRDSMKGDGAKEMRRELFRKWGYDSFEEYCEREVGMLRRSASSLRRAYWWFEIHLTLPAELKTKIKALGRSKIYALTGFVTSDDVIGWVDKAAEMTHDELTAAIKKAKGVRQKPNDEDIEMFEHAKAAKAVALDPSEPPPPEHTTTLTTSLYDGQFETWQAAYDRAKSVTGSDKISHNLEMICTDYLATNDFLDPAEDQKMFLAKVEKLTGLKIIAIDPSTAKPIFGADLLWGLVQQRLEFEKDDREKRPMLKVVDNASDGEPPASF